MAVLQCELCGGKVVGKHDGVFQCESCGTEYSMEWAKQKTQGIRGAVNAQSAAAKECPFPRETTQKPARRKKGTALIATCLVLIAAAAAVAKFVVFPAVDYQKAVKLMEQGSYEEAIAAFTAMGDYRDSTAQIQACETAILDGQYALAESLLAEGKNAQAAIVLYKLGDYQNTKQRSMELWNQRGKQSHRRAESRRHPGGCWKKRGWPARSQRLARHCGHQRERFSHCRSES